MQTQYKIDQATGLPYHDDGTERRLLGALPPTRSYNLPSFSQKFETLDESQWVEGTLRNPEVKILNQGRHGSCVGHGSCTAFTFSWKLSGQTLHDFSPTSIYAHINNDKDQGAQVSQGLECLKRYGTCFMEQFGENQIYLRDLSKEAQTTALRFRVENAYKINSWAQMGSALSIGMVVVSGFAVGHNFSKLDSAFVAPLPDTIAGGHCVAHIGLKKIRGVWMVDSQNSWASSWGDGGYFYMQQAAWNQRGFGFDAFAIIGVLDDPGDKTDDPPILTKKEKNHDEV